MDEITPMLKNPIKKKGDGGDGVFNDRIYSKEKLELLKAVDKERCRLHRMLEPIDVFRLVIRLGYKKQ